MRATAAGVGPVPSLLSLDLSGSLDFDLDVDLNGGAVSGPGNGESQGQGQEEDENDVHARGRASDESDDDAAGAPMELRGLKEGSSVMGSGSGEVFVDHSQLDYEGLASKVDVVGLEREANSSTFAETDAGTIDRERENSIEAQFKRGRRAMQAVTTGQSVRLRARLRAMGAPATLVTRGSVAELDMPGRGIRAGQRRKGRGRRSSAQLGHRSNASQSESKLRYSSISSP